MKKIRYSTKAKKDLKKYRNDLQLMKALYDVLEKLANGTILPKEYKAHVLIGKYKDCMECHIKSNFLLIWIDTEHDVIEIVRIGGQCKNLRGKFINCYLCLQIHSLWS